MKKAVTDKGVLDVIETPEEYFKTYPYEKAWFLINSNAELEEVRPIPKEINNPLEALLEEKEVKVPNKIIHEILENTGIKLELGTDHIRNIMDEIRAIKPDLESGKYKFEINFERIAGVHTKISDYSLRKIDKKD